jgi:hypothetical protein
MKNRTKKTAIILVAIFTIALVSGNALLAQEREIGGLISAADAAFAAEGTNRPVTKNSAPVEESSAGLISTADFAFVSQPFSEFAGNRKPSENNETTGLIAAADYGFVTAGQGAASAADCDVFANTLASNCIPK